MITYVTVLMVPPPPLVFDLALSQHVLKSREPYLERMSSARATDNQSISVLHLTANNSNSYIQGC